MSRDGLDRFGPGQGGALRQHCGGLCVDGCAEADPACCHGEARLVLHVGQAERIAAHRDAEDAANHGQGRELVRLQRVAAEERRTQGGREREVESDGGADGKDDVEVGEP